MRKLPAVEEARRLMQDAIDWGLWRWLLEKRRVREVADRATAALDEADRKAKHAWDDDLQHAYQELTAKQRTRTAHPAEKPQSSSDRIPNGIKLAAKAIKEADDKAERARVKAEATFDEAERRMSTELAREGARQALQTYDLREAAIRKSEAAIVR